MQLRDARGTGEFAGPFPGFRQIRRHRTHVRMETGKDAEIVFVLVDGDEIGVSPVFQFDDEILPDEAGGTGNDDLCVLVNHVQSLILRNAASGMCLMTCMMPHQNQGR